MANKESMPNGGSSSGGSGGSGSGGGGGKPQDRGRGRAQVQYTKPQSMGCYCFLHSFHPAGKNHTSATCTWNQPNLVLEALCVKCTPNFQQLALPGIKPSQYAPAAVGNSPKTKADFISKLLLNIRQHCPSYLPGRQARR